MSEKVACVVCKEKMVGTEQGSLEYKQSSSRWSLLQLLDFFFFFIDHFILFILASLDANDKTATESELLNNIAGVKYAHNKISAGVVER